jgi:hypothetical protein
VNISRDSLSRISNALEIHIGDLFRKRKEPVLKITVKEKSPLSKFSSQDLQIIKKALRILNRTFSKV